MIRLFVDPIRQMEIFQDISDISKPRKSYFFMLCLSGIIASYGLLANSTAVVIGAMLIAPLMGPIFGIALSLTAGDKKLFKDSMASEIFGVISVILLSALIGLVSVHPEFGTEIIARTQPNLYDVLIALASGLAGAYVMIDKRLSPMLAGVAIATALVPPAATCGLCLSIGNWSWASGAFLLFLSNLISIEFAAAFLFFLAGMFNRSEDKKTVLITLIKQFGLRLIIFAFITAVATTTLLKLVDEKNFKHKMKNIISQEVTSVFGARLLDLQYTRQGEDIDVIADIVTPQEFDPYRVRQIQTALEKQICQKIHLVVRSLISRGTDENGPVFLSGTEIEQIEKAKAQQDFFYLVSGVIKEGFREQPGVQVVDISRDKINGIETIQAVVRTPKEINPENVAKIQETLNRVLKSDVRLVVRSTITCDADATHYLYEEIRNANKKTKKDVVLWQNIEKILKSNLADGISSIKIKDIHRSDKNGKLIISVEVIAPKIIGYAKTKSLGEIIRKKTGEDNLLKITSILGGESVSKGYETNKKTKKK